ncbi:MAG: hypothetical protein PHE43_00220 [Candidatus Nanoarchaeia archaeon]|nr:hypothetical protein [Candidatus Nanoarchaeia archaeon]
MNKRGQVTLYIIVGLIVVVIISLVIILTRSVTKDIAGEKAVISSGEEIYDFTQQCIEEVGEDALVLIAGQGGNYKEYPEVINFNGHNIARYCGADKLTGIPDESSIEDELNFYFQDNLLSCLGYYSGFEEQGYKIEYGTPEVELTLLEDITGFDVKFNIKASKGGKEISYSEFVYESDFPFLRLYSEANKQYLSELQCGCGINSGCMTENGPTNVLMDETSGSKIIVINYGGSLFKFAM